MGHKVARPVTAGPSPAVHAGLNFNRVSYTLSETASGSTTIAMCVLPPGARVAYAVLSVDTNAMGIVATPGFIETSIRTGGTSHGSIIQSSSANIVVQAYNPVYEALTYRCTSSSQVWVSLHNMPASGTATSILSLDVVYDCQLEGD